MFVTGSLALSEEAC